MSSAKQKVGEVLIVMHVTHAETALNSRLIVMQKQADDTTKVCVNRTYGVLI